MDELTEGTRAQFHLLPRPTLATDKGGDNRVFDLAPIDVVCRLRTLGSWHEKKLDPVSWQHVGHGVHVLTLDPDDIPEGDDLTILVEGRAGLTPAMNPILRTVRVTPPRPYHVPGDLPVTTVCGRLVGLDGKPRVKVPLTFRIHQAPLLSGGVAVMGDVATAETDDRGYFQIDLITGACVAVQIQAIAYNRIVVIPPPPAVGIPVRLFSI